MPGPRRYRTLLLALALLGSLLVLLTTARGVGLSPDSATYIDVARNLLHGRGLQIGYEAAAVRPLTQYPPLYPVLLAAGGLVDADPQVAARYLNVAFFAALILLVAGAAYRRTASFRIAAAAALFTLASVDLIHVHSVALAEAPFLLAGLLSLVLVSAYLEDSQPRWLAAAAVAAACSCLARYPGVAFVAAGVAGLLWFRRETLRRGAVEALVFAVVGSLPVAVWLARNLAIAHNVSSNVASAGTIVNPLRWSGVGSGLATIAYWALPSPAPDAVRFGVLGLLVVSVIGLGIFARAESRRGGAPDATPHLPALSALLLLFAAIYLPLLVVSRLTISQGFLDRRFLAPIYVALVLCLADLAGRWSRPLRAAPALRSAAVTTVVALAVIYCASAAGWTLRGYVNGLGYAARSWTDSALMARVRELPPEATIYTNAADAVYLLAGRSSFWLSSLDALSPVAGASMLPQRDGRGVIVFFDALSRRSKTLDRAALAGAPGLRLVLETSDGAMWAGSQH
jgi:4-amino-4-deoxy-L-arabinose transferase-like glycosyltransferase